MGMPIPFGDSGRTLAIAVNDSFIDAMAGTWPCLDELVCSAVVDTVLPEALVGCKASSEAEV